MRASPGVVKRAPRRDPPGALIRFLDGISEAQARWNPPDGEWSIALGLEHIMLTETYFRTNVLNVLRQAETSGVWDNAPEHPVKMSAQALRRREQGVVLAPEVSEPQGDRDMQEMIAALIPDREASRERSCRIAVKI